MNRFILLRHGQSDLGGITSEGARKIEATAEILASEGLEDVSVVCFDTPRHRASAEIIAHALGVSHRADDTLKRRVNLEKEFKRYEEPDVGLPDTVLVCSEYTFTAFHAIFADVGYGAHRLCSAADEVEFGECWDIEFPKPPCVVRLDIDDEDLV